MKGFVLVGCLVLIACFSLICLALCEELRWQQKIINMQIQSYQSRVHIMGAIQLLKKEISLQHLTCVLSFDQANEAFDQLLNGSSQSCFSHESSVEMHYLVVRTFQDQGLLYLIARMRIEDPWQKFQIEWTGV